jgi:hypothetical protein
VLASAPADCSRRWELGWEAVVADTAARREDEVAAEVGRVCRVQLRRAGPADAGTGRIFSLCAEGLSEGRGRWESWRGEQRTRRVKGDEVQVWNQRIGAAGDAAKTFLLRGP